MSTIASQGTMSATQQGVSTDKIIEKQGLDGLNQRTTHAASTPLTKPGSDKKGTKQEGKDSTDTSKSMDTSTPETPKLVTEKVTKPSWNVDNIRPLDQIDNGRPFGTGFRPKMTSSRAPLELVEIEDEDEDELWADDGADDDDEDYPY